MVKSDISKTFNVKLNKIVPYSAEAKKMESYLKNNGYKSLSTDTTYVNSDVFIKKLPDGEFSVLHRIGKTNYFVEAVDEAGSAAKLDARTCALNLKNRTVKQLVALDKDSNKILDSNEFLK